MNIADKITRLFIKPRVIEVIVFENSQMHAIRKEDFKRRGNESRGDWIKRIQEKAVSGKHGDELAGSYAARYPKDRESQLSTLQFSQLDADSQSVVRLAYEKAYTPGDVPMPVRSMHKEGVYSFRAGLGQREFDLERVSLS